MPVPLFVGCALTVSPLTSLMMEAERAGLAAGVLNSGGLAGGRL
ncbi:hypothetical protein ABZ835_23470 [Streptomyces sp. NPDC047461]